MRNYINKSNFYYSSAELGVSTGHPPVSCSGHFLLRCHSRRPSIWLGGRPLRPHTSPHRNQPNGLHCRRVHGFCHQLLAVCRVSVFRWLGVRQLFYDDVHFRWVLVPTCAFNFFYLLSKRKWQRVGKPSLFFPRFLNNWLCSGVWPLYHFLVTGAILMALNGNFLVV